MLIRLWSPLQILSTLEIVQRYICESLVGISRKAQETCHKTGLYKGDFVVLESFNHILGTNSHKQETCICENFESNGVLIFLYCVL